MNSDRGHCTRPGSAHLVSFPTHRIYLSSPLVAILATGLDRAPAGQSGSRWHACLRDLRLPAQNGGRGLPSWQPRDWVGPLLSHQGSGPSQPHAWARCPTRSPPSGAVATVPLALHRAGGGHPARPHARRPRRRAHATAAASGDNHLFEYGAEKRLLSWSQKSRLG